MRHLRIPAFLCLCLLIGMACSQSGTAWPATQTALPTSADIAPTPSPSPTVSPTQTPTPSSLPTLTPVPTSLPTLTPVPTSLPSPVLGWSADQIVASCPTQDELDLINSHFDILFAPEANLAPYACQDGLNPDGSVNPRLAVYQALRAMGAMTFDAPLPWTEFSLYDWLRQAITGIVLKPVQNSYCCDGQGRIVLKSSLMGQPSHAAWHNPQTGIGLESLVGLIVHEARHAEIGGHTCDGTDDATLEELGAWGTQYWLYIWLADHTPAGFLTQAERQAAHSHASTALSRICNP